MQFTWLNKQGVKSDTGFIVQSVARFTIEYRENGKVISVDVESDYGPNSKPCEYVKKENFLRWDDGALLLPEKQSEVINNFTAAMEFQGITVIVED